jgi:hypothetical protein
MESKSNSKNFLYKIPQQLFATEIISNYLSCNELYTLNTSLSNKKLRKEYFNNILNYVIFDTVIINNDSQALELHKKGIKLRKLLRSNCTTRSLSDNGINMLLHTDILSLDLDESEITDITIYNIAKNCKNLESISLKKCNISHNSLLILTKNCTKLKSLNLENCNLRTEDTDKHLQYILDIKYTNDNEETIILKQQILDFYNKNIKELNLAKCNFISHGLQYMNQLEYLNLNNNNYITDSSLKYFKNLTNLKELHIKNWELTLDGIIYLCEHNQLNNLIALSIDATLYENEENVAIKLISNTFQKLIYLDLGLIEIYDSLINYISKKIHSLETLTFKVLDTNNGDSYISDISIINLLEQCKNLKSLTIEGFELKYYIYEYLSYKYPDCKIITDGIKPFSRLFSDI